MKRTELIEIYKKVLMDIINAKYVHKFGRKNKYDNEYYLNKIFEVLFFGVCWEDFNNKGICESTIRKKFYKWRDDHIFIAAYKIILKEYTKQRIIKELFIDSTIIENANCCELIDKYYKVKTKNQFKISVICDNNRVPLSYAISNPKPHDVTFVKPLIENLDCHLKKDTFVVGDKGYITNDPIIKQKNIKITIVAPKRKNQKKVFDSHNEYLLNKRYKIEQLFSHLKRTYRRLKYCYDRYIKNYETFLIMGITCQIIRSVK